MSIETSSAIAHTALDFPLTAQHIRFVCETTTPLDLGGAHAGMWLRGALGNVMSRAHCDGDRLLPDHAASCPICWLLAGENSAEKSGNDRRCYTLVPTHDQREVLGAGQRFEFGLSLFGLGQRSLPYFLLAVPEIGVEGVGRGRGKFSLCSAIATNPITGDRQIVLAEGDPTMRMPTLTLTHADVLGEANCLIDDVVSERANEDQALRLRLHFRTPTRLVHDGRLVKVPDFGIFFRRLLRQMDDLAGQFCIDNWRRSFDNMTRLHQTADSVRMVDARVRWLDLNSHSSRKSASSPIGGFVGSAEYLAPASTWRVLMPWILWGTVTQVGRNTVKGDGLYRLELF